MRLTALGITIAFAALAANTSVEFNPQRPESGPFPSNALTVPDTNQKTGLRVNLPFPNCLSPTGLVACSEILAVNRLDGFNTKGRIRVSFSGPVNPDTLRSGLAIVWLDSAVPVEYSWGEKGKITPVNEVVYDPQTNTAYARPDEILDQSRRYAVVVTSEIRDRAGDPVIRSTAFESCVGGSTGNPGCAEVVEALPVIQQAVNGRVVAASVFTTLSATAVLEAGRRALESTQPGFKRVAGTNVFEAAKVASITWRRQVRTSGGNKFDDFALPIPQGLLASSGVGRVAFGSFQSPNYIERESGVFPALVTGRDLPAPGSVSEIHFHVYLPESAPPPGGYPVVIAGHGITDSRFGMPTILALAFCKQGYAVVAMNAVGHGYGPESSLLIGQTDGTTAEVPVPGRGVDQGSGTIGESDGFFAPFGANAILLGRDSMRQTALDLSQLVRTIQGGIDLDGSGAQLLNGGDISFFGQSLGAFYGTMFLAVEPGVRAAVLNVGGDSLVRTALLSEQYRPVAIQYLSLRGLMNKGVNDFDANAPLRNEPVRVNNVQGAIDIQNAEEILHWIEAPGRPGNYAPRLVAATLPGVSTKRMLFQYAIGDRSVPNPANTGLVLDAFAREQASILRFDLLRTRLPGLRNNPHQYFTSILDDPATAAVALTAQAQALLFLASGTLEVPNVNETLRQLFGVDPFQTPETLPEGLNWN